MIHTWYIHEIHEYHKCLNSKESTLPLRNPEKALMRTRSSRTVKSTKNKDFEYSFMLPNFNLSCPSVTSALGARLQSTPLTSKALEAPPLANPLDFFVYFQSKSFNHSIFLPYFCALAVSTGGPNSSWTARSSRAARPAGLLGPRSQRNRADGLHVQAEWNAIHPRPRPPRPDQRVRWSNLHSSPQARRPMASPSASARADGRPGRTPSVAGWVPCFRSGPSRTPSVRRQRRVAALRHRTRSTCCSLSDQSCLSSASRRKQERTSASAPTFWKPAPRRF